MQLMIFETDAENNPQSSYGKTFPGYLTRKTMPSVVFSQSLQANQRHSSHQGENGQTLVLSLDHDEALRGEFLTLNTSDWPNDANVCLLSQVLETTLISEKYSLSSTACKGLLNRAEKRGKVIPEPLRSALMQISQSQIKVTT